MNNELHGFGLALAGAILFGAGAWWSFWRCIRNQRFTFPTTFAGVVLIALGTFLFSEGWTLYLASADDGPLTSNAPQLMDVAYTGLPDPVPWVPSPTALHLKRRRK